MTQAIGVYLGRIPNPHVLYGQEDIETGPVTFARYATRWGDVQLDNGWNHTNMGRRMLQPAASWFAMAQPTIPGQTRLIGQNPSDFIPASNAPSQWQFHYDSSAGMQPNTPGGPGQVAGRTLVNMPRGA